MRNINKNVLFFVDCFERLSFFKRLSFGFRQKGFNVVFLTDSLSTYLNVKDRESVYLVRNTNKNDITDLSESLDVINNNQSIPYANKYYSCVYNTLDKINKKIKIDYIFVWNGSGTSGCAIKDFATNKTIKTAFMELSNFPGKIFVDIDGVNARSWLYKNIKILQKKYPNSKLDPAWVDWWYNAKLLPLPQKEIINRYNNEYIVDRIFSAVFQMPFCNELKIKNYLFKKKKLRKISSFNCEFKYSETPECYVFLPLQVSSDSQLKLNSEYDNVQCILKAKDISESRGADLVVKLHPAEKDQKEIEKIKILSKDIGFYISNKPTMELLSDGELICVNNSTVGLEAKILGKETMVFGKALYSVFDEQMTAAYLNQWLINIDYFDVNEIIDESKVDRILEIIEYCYVN
ncbi:hypothetical protein [Xenorhabdus japonica]|uniref:Capsular polysaccharide export protein n=1 Tax=Xenorhabdus japonica TaxID=53341 RepID=A0A1I5E7C3_9GAMM|nr:hypothetical protein [Xenorhabdus japonica]SFO07011.1 capsular polysaccharide export protein [Xenorhabdus japonica]